MKFTVQLSLSGAALAGLALATAVHATNLAEQPLKVSVLAKPNVVFTMDDSGSMDYEVLIDGTEGGKVWFSLSNSTLYPGNKPRDGSGSGEDDLTYLFPNGTNSGARVYSDASSSLGRGIPPTPELAWTRSVRFNPIYYDSLKTYVPWAPGYLSGATATTFTNANAAAAKSHPVIGTETIKLDGDLNASATNWKFTFTAGMTIPAGATGITCTSGSRSAGQAVTTGNGSCLAALTYYPATFWHAQSCTVNGSDCVTAPDGTTTLKRHEIKSGNSFPSGRSYSAEMQNFANWFQYHRKRRLMAAAAMGRVLEDMSGLRLGVVGFNNRVSPTMYDADDTNPANNRLAVSGLFYKTAIAANGTPTHTAMAYVRGQFDTNTGIIQYACQRNAQFVITDGFANDSAVAPPAYAQATWGAAAPYQSISAGSLADQALAYYTLRLRATTSPLSAGRVPLGPSGVENPDLNPDLHLNAYAVTLGLRGTLWPTATSPFTTAPSWPTPASDTPSMIDDLWHATINGRGKMYAAWDASDAADGINAGLLDILDQAGAQASIGVSSVNLGRGDDNVYLGRYNTRGWSGDLTRNAVNPTTGEVSSTSAWEAAALLAARDGATRLIFSSNDSTGLDFTEASFGSTVNPDAASFSNAQVVNYLRGSRTGEGSTVRSRTSLIGAVINAEPVVSRADGVIYLASGEGLLHAFDANTGNELWAYQPADTLAAVGQSVQRGWVFKTLLDAAPTFAQLSTGPKMLFGGLGAAGRSYYALDVSSPRPANAAAAAAQFRWVFPASTDAANRALMGYTVGRPVATQTAADGQVVLVTSGYDNGLTIGDGKGRLWMLNATTGAVLKSFRTTQGALGAEAGLAHVSAFKESDGSTRYAYGGDLLGNLWRFDLTKSGAGPHDAELVATFLDAAGNRQPVMAPPELVMMSGKRVILVGTGRLLDITDFGSAAVQSFYAVADGATLANARAGLVAQTYTRSTDTLSANPVNWTTGRGWYFDLPAGEQANTAPSLAYGAVSFVTNKIGSTDCSQSSYLYLVDIGGGTKVASASFVATLISGNATASRVITLRGTSGKLFATSHRSDNSVHQRELPAGAAIPPSKNAWRELRR